ncbi:MAG: PepSY-associated TM helix domain-containing protein [Acidobacteriota bacterium]|nr:PepSY-associated TM helix domain-containing protein [Acidobacteriota bacterium]
MKTGQGERESYIRTQVLAQFRQLHIDTNYAWIWYSDIFGLAMLTIAFTGMFVRKGDKGFRQRGWKLCAVGIIFPLIFLFLLA